MNHLQDVLEEALVPPHGAQADEEEVPERLPLPEPLARPERPPEQALSLIHTW